MRTGIFLLLCVSLIIMLPECTGGRTSGEGSPAGGQQVVIKGQLDEGAGSQVILEEMAAREYIPIDTAICNAKGEFLFSFVPEQIAFYVLRYGQDGYVTLLLEPGESLDFSCHISDPASCRLGGSEGSELLQELSVKHRESLEELREIARMNMELSSSPDFAALKPDLDRQFDSITALFREYSLGFIRENRASLSILVALYNMYGQGLPVFDPMEDLDVYRYVDSVLTLRYQGYEAVELLHAQVLQADQVLRSQDPGEGLKNGDIAPDFVSSRPDRSTLTLSELRGNYVLLSFWAGWSHLSRAENQVLRMAAEQFGDDNFRILQVSFDDNREVWTGAISDDRLDWDHVSDLMRWDAPVADLYRVEKVPSNYLIGPEGKILASDLFGERLLEQLESIFSEQ